MLIKNRWCVEGTQVTLCHLLTSLCLDFFQRKMDTITYFIGLLWGLIELLIIQLEQYCTWHKFIVSWCKGAVLFLHLRISGGLPLWPRAPWLRLQSSNAGDTDLNTGWGTKVPQASRSKSQWYQAYANLESVTLMQIPFVALYVDDIMIQDTEII